MNDSNYPNPGEVWEDSIGDRFEIVGIATIAGSTAKAVFYKSQQGKLLTLGLGTWFEKMTSSNYIFYAWEYWDSDDPDGFYNSTLVRSLDNPASGNKDYRGHTWVARPLYHQLKDKV